MLCKMHSNFYLFIFFMDILTMVDNFNHGKRSNHGWQLDNYSESQNTIISDNPIVISSLSPSFIHWLFCDKSWIKRLERLEKSTEIRMYLWISIVLLVLRLKTKPSCKVKWVCKEINTIFYSHNKQI